MPDEELEPVVVAETHISRVFFVGDRAYKLKKPVRTDFLDFSTREARREICGREVELNRRLAPDVYLGVADIVDTDGAPLDHLVVMRRMPPERRLSTLVAEGAPPEDCLRRVARTVVAFHAEAETSDEIARAGTRQAVRGNWDDNFREMDPYVGPVIDHETFSRAEELAHRYLDGRGPLLEHRLNDGRIRDGHGDLLATDVFCLDDGPRILDCIEFSDRLRHGDVVADVAFLAMDLERLGHPELADRFLAWYRDLSGDRAPSSLVDHYVAYRAQVRSKVACLRHEQGDPDAADDASFLLALCLRHLERARVRLVLVGGLPGTGKSTLAEGIARSRGRTLLRSDEVRKELAGIESSAPAGAAYGEGLYTPEVTEATYGELLDRAADLLGQGETVVVDASWMRAEHRSKAAAVSKEAAADLVQLRCTVDPDEAARRMGDRRDDPSDATPEIAARMAEEAQPWPEAHEIDTADTPEEALRRAERLLDT